MTCTLTWRFRNEHVWTKEFDTEDELTDFVNRTGLVSHPDIDLVKAQPQEGVEIFFKDGLTHW